MACVSDEPIRQVDRSGSPVGGTPGAHAQTRHRTSETGAMCRARHLACQPRLERRAGPAQRAGEVDDVARLRAITPHRCRGCAEDGDTEREDRRACRIATDNRRLRGRARIANAVQHFVELAVPRFRCTERDQDTQRFGAHRGQIGQCGHRRTPADFERRDPGAPEVHIFGGRVGADDESRARGHIENRRVIADAVGT